MDRAQHDVPSCIDIKIYRSAQFQREDSGRFRILKVYFALMGVSLDTQPDKIEVIHFLFPPLFISFNCGSVLESMVMECTNEICTLRKLVCCVGGMGYGCM